MSDLTSRMLPGLDGRPLLKPDGTPIGTERARLEVTDAGATFAKGREAVTLSPKDLLMAMARRQRDGASHAAIIAEFELLGRARSPHILERALALGRKLLDEAIERGEEPAETIWKRIVEEGEDEE